MILLPEYMILCNQGAEAVDDSYFQLGGGLVCSQLKSDGI